MKALMVKRNTILTNYRKFFKRWRNWNRIAALAALMIQGKVRNGRLLREHNVDENH
jgi:hypothetical protein